MSGQDPIAVHLRTAIDDRIAWAEDGTICVHCGEDLRCTLGGALYCAHGCGAEVWA
jgi:hypothetical protein